jgi:hypothetical protein
VFADPDIVPKSMSTPEDHPESQMSDEAAAPHEAPEPRQTHAGVVATHPLPALVPSLSCYPEENAQLPNFPDLPPELLTRCRTTVTSAAVIGVCRCLVEVGGERPNRAVGHQSRMSKA